MFLFYVVTTSYSPYNLCLATCLAPLDYFARSQTCARDDSDVRCCVSVVIRRREWHRNIISKWQNCSVCKNSSSTTSELPRTTCSFNRTHGASTVCHVPLLTTYVHGHCWKKVTLIAADRSETYCIHSHSMIFIFQCHLWYVAYHSTFWSVIWPLDCLTVHERQ